MLSHAPLAEALQAVLQLRVRGAGEQLATVFSKDQRFFGQQALFLFQLGGAALNVLAEPFLVGAKFRQGRPLRGQGLVVLLTFAFPAGAQPGQLGEALIGLLVALLGELEDVLPLLLPGVLLPLEARPPHDEVLAGVLEFEAGLAGAGLLSYDGLLALGEVLFLPGESARQAFELQANAVALLLPGVVDADQAIPLLGEHGALVGERTGQPIHQGEA